MKYEILGKTVPVVEVTLNRGESINAFIKSAVEKQVATML